MTGITVPRAHRVQRAARQLGRVGRVRAGRKTPRLGSHIRGAGVDADRGVQVRVVGGEDRGLEPARRDADRVDATGIGVPASEDGPGHVGDRAGVPDASPLEVRRPDAPPAAPVRIRVEGVDVRIQDDEPVALRERVVLAGRGHLVRRHVTSVQHHHERRSRISPQARRNVHRVGVHVAVLVHVPALVARRGALRGPGRRARGRRRRRGGGGRGDGRTDHGGDAGRRAAGGDYEQQRPMPHRPVA